MELISPNRYNIRFTDTFFFDTNIWLLLFGTVANFQKEDQKDYSSFLQQLLSKKNSIYLTSMIISEFANVLLRKDFKQWILVNKLVGKEFKADFVGTNEYKKSVSVISSLINKIISLPNVLRVSDEFTNINISNILQRFEEIDFNDAYYVELATTRGYIMVSNDKDFIKIKPNLMIISTQKII